MKTTLPIAAALLLTACSGGSGASSNAQEAAIANRITLDNSGKPRPSPTPRHDHATLTFPPAMLGRWGITEGDCDPSNSANKGLMVISADTVRFYESQARLTGMASRSEYVLAADLAFQGEGQKWTARQSFALVSGGTALVRGEQSPSRTYRYDRC